MSELIIHHRISHLNLNNCSYFPSFSSIIVANLSSTPYVTKKIHCFLLVLTISFKQFMLILMIKEVVAIFSHLNDEVLIKVQKLATLQLLL